jgi:hypothetical protein
MASKVTLANVRFRFRYVPDESVTIEISYQPRADEVPRDPQRCALIKSPRQDHSPAVFSSPPAAALFRDSWKGPGFFYAG